MQDNLIAKASTKVNAPIDDVWDALVNPAAVKEYMFGATILTDWNEGSSIVWRGEWKGKPFEDKGKVLRVGRPNILKYSHFSPLTGEADKPENYHTVTVELTGDKTTTSVSLTQDKNVTEEAREHSEKNWQGMLEGLKNFVEK